MPAAKPRHDNLTARDVMQTDVQTVSRSTSFSEVERVLGEHRIGGVPVTDEAGHIVGIVSVRDLLERYAQDPDSRPRRGRGSYHVSSQGLATEESEELDAYEVPNEAEETVADIMNSDIYSVTAATPVNQVASKMIEHRIHRILVQEDKRFVGLISTFDLLAALTD